jgi:glutamate synthase domain-containing protein 3
MAIYSSVSDRLLLGMNAPSSHVVHRLSLDQYSESQLHARFAEIAVSEQHIPSSDSTLSGMTTVGSLIEIEDARGQDSVLMGITAPVRMHVKGPLGHYPFSYNLAADARIDGDVGNGAGEGLRGGSVRVRGASGMGCGVAMRGGTLAVYGTAGDRLAAAMVGGEIFARGNVGNDVGVGAHGGTIVIGGDAGERLGEPLGNLIIFLRGKALSYAPGMVETTLRKRDELRLGLLLINASIRGDAKEFRRVIPEHVFEAERSRQHGEVNPNWR